MTLLETWVATPAANALGWTLFYSLGEGALIALVLAAVLWIARPSRVRYTAACLAMLAMLTGFAITFSRVLSQQRVRGVARALVIPPPPDDLAGSMRHVRPGSFWSADILPWLAPFWIAGVLAFHLRSLAGWLATRRLCRTAVCLAPDPWAERLDELRERLRVSRPVVLLESGLAAVPVVVGYLRPVILMPAGLLAGLPAAQIETILLHELAHVRRCDYLVNLMQAFVEGLLFYHPAVWWISGVIRAERENCCDDLVVATLGDASVYATALATLEVTRSSVPAPAAAATGGSLVKRIRRLLAPPEPPRAALAPVVTAVVLTLTAVMALTAWQTKPASPAPEIRDPYTAWLNEDVAYLITEAERRAFLNLRFREEQDKFIEQFWERRNPLPGSRENSAKEEHYRRIAYANEHFASTTNDGWKTDRGRTYILYGPPNEIESHPSGGTYIKPSQQGGGKINTYPFEQWRYRHIDGVGDNIIIEFVDPDGSGEYRMTYDPTAKESPAGPQKHAALTAATVVTPGDGTARVSISLEGYAGHPITVFGRLLDSHGRIAGQIKEFVKPPLTGERVYTLRAEPGSYQLYIAVQDLTTNTLYSSNVPFTSR